MVPKVYLSPKDVTEQSGSVISGNNVQLAGGKVTNSGSSLLAQNGLAIDTSIIRKNCQTQIKSRRLT